MNKYIYLVERIIYSVKSKNIFFHIYFPKDEPKIKTIQLHVQQKKNFTDFHFRHIRKPNLTLDYEEKTWDTNS